MLFRSFRSSLMSTAQLNAYPPSFIPHEWLWSNYSKALETFEYWTYFKNTFGMPIIFPPRFNYDLQNVLGDRGGREIINNNPNLVRKVYFKDEILGMDMDKPEDIQALE